MLQLERGRLSAAAAIGIIAILFAAVPTEGVRAQGGATGTQERIGADARVTLNAVDQPLADVCRFIGERAGVNVILANGIDEKVTVDLKDVPWRIALEIIAEKTSCMVVEKAANVIRIEQPEAVTFDYTGADIKEVVDSIAKIASV